MILYNTTMGVAAGLAMLALVRFWTHVRRMQAAALAREAPSTPLICRRRPTVPAWPWPRGRRR